MHSKSYNGIIIKTSENHHNIVNVTAQRIKNDINGNARYRLQVWLMRGVYGSLWCPKVKGYRLNKNDEYTIKSSDLDYDVLKFMDVFEKAVKA